MSVWAVAAVILLNGPPPPAKPCPAITRFVPDRTFAPGQVWSYRSRPGDPASTVTILEIDSSAKVGLIVHVRVDGLAMHNPDGDLISTIGHMPFSRDALLLSVNRQVRAVPPPAIPEGYTIWQKDCGGVYTISVAEAVDVDERTLSRH